MFKIMICPNDLEMVALRDIRSFPGGEYVTYVQVEGSSEDWTLKVTARDGADLERIEHAVKKTTSRLKHRYSLRADW